MATQDIIDYYTNLLIIQYNNKPKARAMVSLFVQELIASNILQQIRDAYSVDTAVGVQLDVIGKYVGIDRFYSGQDLSGYFSFLDYDDVTTPPSDRIGFSNYTDWETKAGKWLIYSNVLSTDSALGDDDYRILIKLKIIQNTMNHSHKAINDAMESFFNSEVYADSSGDMLMNYFAPFDRSAIIQVAMQKDLLPRPMGVKLGYVIEYTEPFFGFTTYDGGSALIEGFTDYTDYDTQAGDMLNYDNLLEV